MNINLGRQRILFILIIGHCEYVIFSVIAVFVNNAADRNGSSSDESAFCKIFAGCGLYGEYGRDI